MKYIPHAIAIAVVLLLPLVLSILIGATAFAAYTLYIQYAFYLHAPEGLQLSYPEAATLAIADVGRLFSF